MAPNDFKQGRVGRALVASTVAAMAALFATPASATTPPVPQVEGTATISLAGQKGLQELPIVDLDLGRTTVARTSGVLKLSLQGRKAKLRRLVLRISDGATSISARLGKQRLVVFRAEGKAQIGDSSVKLSKAALSLTGAGAEALRSRLGLDSLAAGELGALSLNARKRRFRDKVISLPTTPVGISLEGDALPADEQPEQPDPGEPYPYEAECPVSKSGGPSFGPPPGTVGEPAALPTFDVDQDVTGTTVDWGVKDSLRSYVLSPPAGSTQALDGAGANPAGPSMATEGSFFDFPLATGTYEAGSKPDHSDDKLIADGTGTVLLCKSGHGFNVALKNPTVVIDGDDSRVVADIGANMDGTWYPFQRADIAELDLSAIEPTISDSGNTLAWEDIPATLTADGSTATGLSGFYPPGTELDKVTVSTALDRPVRPECAIDEGVGATMPSVDFTLANLPALSSPVTGNGGTINWGFRRATRNTTTLPAPGGGSFQLLGGANESYPGNMGGPAGSPPLGGTGKFFRFPVSSYAYDAGTPDPGDERLIATSDATVGFCVPNAGNFGVVISKPTLVIDGVNSRIVANAYSYNGGFGGGPALGWIGGRVDLVKLDVSTTAPVAAGNTVSWGEVLPNEQPLNSGISVAGGFLTEALSLGGATLAKDAGAGGFDPIAVQIQLPSP